jgi:DNA-binding transcriptional LysR family regulator
MGADGETILSELEWSDLKVILALFRGGSVASASRILGVDSSTVSRRLAAAEDALGAVLVLRGGREFRFTSEGTMALRVAETIETAVQSAASSIKSAKQAIEGKVTITSVGSFFHVLSPFCELVEKKHVKLRVEINDTDNVLNLSSGEADIAIRFALPKEPELIARKVFEFGWNAYASKDYADHYGLPRSHEELRNHRLILYAENRLHLTQFAWMEQFKSGHDRFARVTNPSVALRSVLAGSGIASLPTYADGEHLGLVRVFPEPFYGQTAYLVFHETMRNSARIRAVSDELVAYLDSKNLNLRGDGNSTSRDPK